MFNFVIDLVKKVTRLDMVSAYYSVKESNFTHFVEACHAFGIEHIKVEFCPLHAKGFLDVAVKVPIEYYVRLDRLVTDNPVNAKNLGVIHS